jgi:hypothetical protein
MGQWFLRDGATKTTIEGLVSASFSGTVLVPVIFAKLSGFVQDMNV